MQRCHTPSTRTPRSCHSSSMLPRCAHTFSQLPAATAGIHTSTAARALMLTLERSVGDNVGKDEALRATNAFSAEVFPDLPIATTWENLWKALKRQDHGTGAGSEGAKAPGSADVADDKLKVITVAANLRPMHEVEARMVAATSPGRPLGPEGVPQLVEATKSNARPVVTGRPADALLLVAGSHPVRTLPGSRQLLPGSVKLLQAASALRQRGQLPASTQLWAVANPNVEPDASGAEQKVLHGAQVLVTQPPFDMEQFTSWVEDAKRRGVLDKAKLLVGHPMISSVGNLAFWLSLSSCVGRSRCQALLREFTMQEGKDKAAFDAFCHEYNKNLATTAAGWGVAGFHMMPITPKGKKACIAALQPGGMLHHLIHQ